MSINRCASVKCFLVYFCKARKLSEESRSGPSYMTISSQLAGFQRWGSALKKVIPAEAEKMGLVGGSENV